MNIQLEFDIFIYLIECHVDAVYVWLVGLCGVPVKVADWQAVTPLVYAAWVAHLVQANPNVVLYSIRRSGNIFRSFFALTFSQRMDEIVFCRVFDTNQVSAKLSAEVFCGYPLKFGFEKLVPMIVIQLPFLHKFVLLDGRRILFLVCLLHKVHYGE